MTPDLFNPVAKARRTDPVTSHMAAREHDVEGKVTQGLWHYRVVVA